MKKILILLIAGALAAFGFTPQPASAYAQDDDITKLYEQYLTPQEQALLDRFEEAQQKSEEAQAVEHNKMMIALIISILIGLIPFVYLLVKSLREDTWKNNPGGTVWGLLIGLAGGVVLFAINYGIFWLRFKYASQFSAVVTYALVGGIIIGMIYLLNKKG